MRGRSCKWFIQLSDVLSQHIHIKGQYTNWALIKDFIKNLWRLRLMNFEILVSALSFLPAFLYSFKINFYTILNCHHCWLQEVFDYCFPKFCKNQYLPEHIYFPILVNDIYPGLVSCSYIQIIKCWNGMVF